MGIESDQLVFDYLSRVGDLAQQRQLPSGARMRLVSSLRNEIDRRRVTSGEETPGTVRGILRELGTPDEVVDRAAGSTPVSTAPEPPVVPQPRTEEGWPTPPHLAGTDEVGAADTEPDWWSTEVPRPRPGDELVPGFRGGVEIPELLKPPLVGDDDEDEDGEGDEAEEEDATPRRRFTRLVRFRRREALEPAVEPTLEPVPEADTAGRRFRLGSPVLVLAALLLLGGAAFGSLIALAVGWLLAYASRRLSRAEARWAVVILPGLVLTAGAVWLWGRVEGRWGAPIAPGGDAMGAALSETWPWVLRAAAITSAVFLLWRSRRHA
ncbi:hypothetical protein [Streptomyces sp. NPDC006551]|uniref:hypothetical protein n=1 Tax=Streptomyces sp. NPDC006551 TaxID=3157178 RepID=UPI0033BD139F